MSRNQVAEVIVEATICKTVFASHFSSLYTVAITLLTGGYFHLHAGLLSITHPQYSPMCSQTPFRASMNW
jgi:hypothetical protein